MKRLSMVLAAVLLVALCLPVYAAEQVAVEARVKPIIEVDGLKFRDLNANGALDVYEDWRKSTSERIENLLDLMTIEEKVGLLFHINTNGGFTPPYPWTEADLEKNKGMIVGLNINHILDNNNGTPDYLADFHNRLQEIAEGTGWASLSRSVRIEPRTPGAA